jgi:hypothetical protein
MMSAGATAATAGGSRITKLAMAIQKKVRICSISIDKFCSASCCQALSAA